MNETKEVEALQRDLANAREARTVAIQIMSDMSRQAGSWQGIAEGKDIIIRQLETDRALLRAALRRIVDLTKRVHPFAQEAEYFRIASAALRETDND